MNTSLVVGRLGPWYPHGFLRRLGLMLDLDRAGILGLWDRCGV